MSRGHKLATWGLIAAALLLTAACAEKITNSDEAADIRINLAFRPQLAADALDRFLITVDAPDLSTRSATLNLRDGMLVGQISVPYGARRHFVLEAFDSLNTAIYRGETTTDIARGQSIQLIIDLFPVVACLNISPHYATTIMGNDISIDMYVWNIINLSAINFDLDFSSTDNLLIFDSLIIGVDLNGQPLSAQAPAASTVSIDISQAGTTAPVSLVDSTGYGKLASVYFHSRYDTPLSVDTALLSMQVNSVNTLTQQFPTDSVFTDGAMIELIKDSQTGENDTTQPTWSRSFGTTEDDWGNAIAVTNSQAILIAGQSYSKDRDWDIYISGIDSTGSALFTKIIGGTGTDVGTSIVPTDDNGCIIAGWMTSPSSGEDIYLARLTDRGDISWENRLAQSGDQRANAMIESSSGDYFIAGRSGAAAADMLLVKTDAGGHPLWSRSYNKGGFDEAIALIETPDNNIILAGVTGSQLTWKYDIWVLKIDGQLGTVLWDKTYGGEELDWVTSIAQTQHDEFILCGYTYSNGAVGGDILLVNIDDQGTINWQKTYGGSGAERGNEIILTGDGGYIIAGMSSSFGTIYSEAYVLKIDALGNEVWHTLFGKGGNHEAFGAARKSRGKLAITGGGESGTSNKYDVFVLQMDAGGSY